MLLNYSRSGRLFQRPGLASGATKTQLQILVMPPEQVQPPECQFPPLRGALVKNVLTEQQFLPLRGHRGSERPHSVVRQQVFKETLIPAPGK